MEMEELRNNRADRATALRRQVERLLLELDRIENLPPEPTSVGTVVVWWRAFGGDRRYWYAAIRSEDGRWYCTGRSNLARAWDELLDFIGHTRLDRVSVRPVIGPTKTLLPSPVGPATYEPHQYLEDCRCVACSNRRANMGRRLRG
jgi:hypothetical protein